MSEINGLSLTEEAQAPSPDAPVGFEIGSDLTPSAPASEATDTRAASQPAAPTFDPAHQDLLRADTASLSPEWQHAQRIARQFQSQADSRVSALERQLQTLQQAQQVDATRQAVREAVAAAQPAPDPLAAVRQRLDPEDVGSIEVVQEIVKPQLTALETALNESNTRLEKAVQLIGILYNNMQGVQSQSVNGQVNEARQAFGQEFTDGFIANNKDRIKQVLESVNPDTGQRYSVTEAIAAMSGRAPQAPATSQSNARTQAQLAIAQNGTPSHAGDQTKMETEEDLLELAGNLGFL